LEREEVEKMRSKTDPRKKGEVGER